MSQPEWVKRARLVLDRRVLAAVAVGLALIVGYQVWAQRQTHRNQQTAVAVKHLKPKVAVLSKVQCANTKLFYDLFNAMAADSSPRFGSPSEGPLVPGARDALIRRLYAAERKASAALRKQGCIVHVPGGP